MSGLYDASADLNRPRVAQLACGRRMAGYALSELPADAGPCLLDKPWSSQPGLEEPETQSQAHRRVLADRIVRGELPAGASAPGPYRQEFGASHTDARARSLPQAGSPGLAISEPRRGVRVASFDIKEVREVAEMRAALEVLARHTAKHLTPAILDAARRRPARAMRRPTFTRLGGSQPPLPSPDPHALQHGPSARLDRRSPRRQRPLPVLRLAFRLRKNAPTTTCAILVALRQGRAEEAAGILERHVQWIGRAPKSTSKGWRKRGEAFAIVG